jgi:hypothetical protein
MPFYAATRKDKDSVSMSLYLKITGAALCALILLTSSSFASPAVNDKNSCADTELTVKSSGQEHAPATAFNKSDIERRVRALLCRARRAEETAAWHEKRAPLGRDR